MGGNNLSHATSDKISPYSLEIDHGDILRKFYVKTTQSRNVNPSDFDLVSITSTQSGRDRLRWITYPKACKTYVDKSLIDAHLVLFEYNVSFFYEIMLSVGMADVGPFYFDIFYRSCFCQWKFFPEK